MPAITMSDSDILIFDIIALEWLIALLAIAAFIVVGVFVDRASRRDLQDLVTRATKARSEGEPTTWHDLTAEAVLKQLHAAQEGLSSEEVRQRLDTHGPNRLPQAKPRSPLLRFLAQFHNLLI
jgi:hypothetical protein